MLNTREVLPCIARHDNRDLETGGLAMPYDATGGGWLPVGDVPRHMNDNRDRQEVGCVGACRVSREGGVEGAKEVRERASRERAAGREGETDGLHDVCDGLTSGISGERSESAACRG